MVEILHEYELNRIIKGLEKSSEKSVKLGFKAVLLNNETEISRLLENITPDTLIAFDTETTDINTQNAEIVGFSFCFNDQIAYYVPIAHKYLGAAKQISLEFAKWAVGQIYKGCVVGQNLKYDFKVVNRNLS